MPAPTIVTHFPPCHERPRSSSDGTLHILLLTLPSPALSGFRNKRMPLTTVRSYPPEHQQSDPVPPPKHVHSCVSRAL